VLPARLQRCSNLSYFRFSPPPLPPPSGDHLYAPRFGNPTCSSLGGTSTSAPLVSASAALLLDLAIRTPAIDAAASAGGGAIELDLDRIQGARVRQALVETARRLGKPSMFEQVRRLSVESKDTKWTSREEEGKKWAEMDGTTVERGPPLPSRPVRAHSFGARSALYCANRKVNSHRTRTNLWLHCSTQFTLVPSCSLRWQLSEVLALALLLFRGCLVAVCCTQGAGVLDLRKAAQSLASERGDLAAVRPTGITTTGTALPQQARGTLEEEPAGPAAPVKGSASAEQETAKLRATALPAAIDLTDCPYASPYCLQPLYAFCPGTLLAHTRGGESSWGKGREEGRRRSVEGKRCQVGLEGED